jgi:hypothetical protein
MTSLVTTPSRLLARYYLVTGIWPLLHRRSFELVTGRKHDFWLARSVGVLVTGLGVALESSNRRGHVSRDLGRATVVGGGGLVLVEVVEVAKGRIRPIYLLDALLQAALFAWWFRRRDD